MQNNEHVRRRFEQARDHGLPVLKIHLRMWAGERNDAFSNKILHFKASRHWLTNFKHKNRIVARRITKIVSRTSISSMGEILSAANTFVARIKAAPLTARLTPSFASGSFAI